MPLGNPGYGVRSEWLKIQVRQLVPGPLAQASGGAVLFARSIMFRQSAMGVLDRNSDDVGFLGIYSLLEVLNGKTILAASKQFALFVGPSTREVSLRAFNLEPT